MDPAITFQSAQDQALSRHQVGSDDVLVEQDYPDRATTRVMVQNWDRVPGTPADLTCLRSTACLTSDDHAPINPTAKSAQRGYDPKVTMTSREINFVDGDGTRVHVQLR